MPTWRSKPLRLIVYGSVMVASFFVFVWLTRWSPAIDAREDLNTIVGVVAAVFTVVPVVLLLWRSRAERLSTPNQLGEAHRMLAVEGLRQWREEAGKRGLVDLPLLVVRWSPADAAVMDRSASVAAAVGGARSGGRVVGLRLTGEVDRVVQEFRRLKVPRVVVLGAPGRGRRRWLCFSRRNCSNSGRLPNQCRCCCRYRRGIRTSKTFTCGSPGG